MLLLPVVVYLLSGVVQQSLQANITQKCCEKSLQIQETNRTLECKDKTNTRYQILADSYNFLENNGEGECIDSSDEQFSVYQVSDWKVISKKAVSPFPKCCPMGHVYSPEMHSCSPKDNVTVEFIKGNFIYVGLPNCRVILDKEFKELDSFDAISQMENMEEGSFCLDKTEKGFVIRECQNQTDVCKKTRCFRKCCPDGQSYVDGGNCRDTYVHGIKVDSQIFSPYIEDRQPSDKYELIYGTGCSKVTLLSKNTIQYSITNKGVFKYYFNYTGTFVEEEYSHNRSYCIEYATKGNIFGYHLFMCYGPREVYPEKFSLTVWAKVLSCVFLLVTIAIYIYLGETKSTFGKILINYCFAMIFLMASLLVAHVSLQPSTIGCKIIGYLLIFFNCASFAWVNVMSLDIWRTFGTPRRTIGSDQRRKDLKKFLLYFLYGWGVPLCQMVLILALESVKILPESIQPYVGIYFCFLENRNYARTLFFLIPQLLFQIINTVFFIKTITYCIRVKNEINRMNDSARGKESGKFTADTERLGLIVKLAVIMGIIWIFEVTTAFFENMKTYSSFTKNLEIIFDTITCLQGIFIFLIFICKKKTFNSIKKKLGLAERRISSSASVTQSSHINGHYPMNKRQTTMSISDSKM